MTEEQFEALVELIRTIADQSEGTGFYADTREREVIARVKEILVEKKS